MNIDDKVNLKAVIDVSPYTEDPAFLVQRQGAGWRVDFVDADQRPVIVTHTVLHEALARALLASRRA